MVKAWFLPECHQYNRVLKRVTVSSNEQTASPAAPSMVVSSNTTRRCNLGNTIERKSHIVRNFLGTMLLLAVFLLAGASASQAQVTLGIRIGPPPQPRVVRVVPRSPGDGYVWVGGYWYPNGRHYAWHAGYWTRPPYGGARWVEPHHDGAMFYAGYWDGDHGRVDHDHRWDKDRDHRDEDRFHDDHR
jgi:hypothetical protein